MSVHTFGDSHSVNGWSTIPYVKIHHLGPKLCYSIGRDGIDIKTGTGVKDGDIVIFCAGEIDCRCHIYKHCKENTEDYKEVIDFIVEAYCKAIQNAVSEFQSLQVAIFNIVPPVEKEKTKENPDFPYLGSDEERKLYTKYFNTKYKELCKRYGYVFFDVYDQYTDSNGFLNRALSDSKVHIKNSIHIENFLVSNFKQLNDKLPLTLSLTQDAGFFSDTLRIVSLALYCESTELPIRIDSRNWLFRVKDGWSDWFESFPRPLRGNEVQIDETLFETEKLYTWAEYSSMAKNVFSLTYDMTTKVDHFMESLNLPSNYVSIFIRRGDKLYEESVYIPTELYCKKLKELSNLKLFHTIFVQTDDIRAVDEVKKFFPDKRVVSTCPSDKYGAYVYFYRPQEGSTCGIPPNAEYFKSLLDKPEQKIVSELGPEEMRVHVEEMLIGLELCKRSAVCCLDYQSNASRYIALTHHRGLKGILAIEGQPFTNETPVRCPRYFPFWS